ncbi:MAG: enoyl-CoA hydratase/isomerase family protein [Candidatus Eisenbacteria bacterium]|nr:enoyl-CoA hydratase/isomerase family protein [Candidatus Eisenbacteria bacterium]
MSDSILLAEADGVATLVLNRPDKLNAFADAMREAFIAAIDAVAASATARVLVITGAGRAFCAGGDVGFMARLKQEGRAFAGGLEPLVDTGRTGIAKLWALPIPTLAAVNGAAAGGGANLALACDLRIASDRASFGQSFVKIGLHPDWGGTYFLPRLVGVAKALELGWLGDQVDAAEALRIGMVERVLPHDRLLDETRALAARLAAAPPHVLRAVKRTMRAGLERGLDECLADELETQAMCWNHADSDEGIRAFAERRAPAFGRSREADPAIGGRFE